MGVAFPPKNMILYKKKFNNEYRANIVAILQLTF